MQKIHSDNPLLPDVDGTVIAAGPIVGGDGTMNRRVVLRKQSDGQFVVHDQQYPKLAQGDTKPFNEYHNGDYCGDSEQMAFSQFVTRLIKMGVHALNIPAEMMIPGEVMFNLQK